MKIRIFLSFIVYTLSFQTPVFSTDDREEAEVERPAQAYNLALLLLPEKIDIKKRIIFSLDNQSLGHLSRINKRYYDLLKADLQFYASRKDSCFAFLDIPDREALSPAEIVERLPSYKRQKILECFGEDGQQEKVLHGHDRRTLLNETVTNSHYNFNVYLELYYANIRGQARIYYGSGVLIGENLVLTAGHNLYDVQDGGYPDRIDCFVACYRNTVLAEATVFPNLDFQHNKSSIFVHPHYIEQENKAHSSQGKSASAKGEKYVFSPWDIGLIVFDKEHVSKIKATWPEINFARPAKKENFEKSKSLLKKEFMITGYPGERRAYSMEGKIIEIDLSQNKLCYNIDTTQGQSGSGICFINKEKIYCVGVHTCAGEKNEKFNIGILIDEEMDKAINKFLLKK